MTTRIVTQAKLWQRLTVAAAVVVVALCAAGYGLWRAQGMRILSVQTASMAPLLEPGDAVVVRQVAASDLRPGDVVSFYAPSAAPGDAVIVTHRIIGVDRAGQFITQGDGNVAADGPLDPSLLVGRASHSLANAGYLVDFLRSPLGLLACIYLPALLLVAIELRRLVRYFRPTYQLTHHGAAR